jgi:hypothetical protein
MASKRWQDWVNLILGLWTIASPWILGLVEGEPAVVWSAWILGASVVVFAALAMFTPKIWEEEAMSIFLGIALATSPWVLGFADLAIPTKNAVIVGLLVIAFGVWAMLRNVDLQKWWHGHYRTR